MSRRASLAAIAVGLALLVGAPAIWWFQQPASTVGDLEALGVPSGTDAAERPDPTTQRRPPTDRDPAPGQDGVPGTAPDSGSDADPQTPNTAPGAAGTTDAETDPGPLTYESGPLSGSLGNLARPARIDIPALGVSSPIDPVGIAPTDEMEIPDDIRRIGWFEPGVIPGRNGTAVLSGHVDSRTQGRGAFYRLRELDVDDTVTITHADGDQRTWRVAARTSYGKDELPIGDIFVRGGEPRLALITCDGSFDATTRSYQDNVVVYAVPA